jgi:hypothetical protein
VLTRPSRLLARHLPLCHGQSLHPAPTSHHAGLCFTRHQRGFTPLTRPVFPSPVAARVERAALGLSPELRTPPTRSRTTHVGVGTGHRTRTWNHTLNITSVDPPIGSSLTTCDLASHDDVQASRGARRRAAASLGGSERKPLAGRHARSSSITGVSSVLTGTPASAATRHSTGSVCQPAAPTRPRRRMASALTDRLLHG